MAYAFDTLGYARRLREGGVPQEHAEVHAEAARDYIMTEIVTKQDLRLALDFQSLRLMLWLGWFNAALAAAVVAVLKLIL